jgi:hypothetical protein
VKHLPRILGALCLLVASALVAYAIQPGTTGTEKQFQEQGLRSGVLIQKNNTATASAGAATLNAAGSGIVTSESLTTAAGSNYTLTLTNNMVAAADIVFATVQLGTSTTGEPMVESITPAANSVVILVRNNHGSAAFNGTIKIGFLVLKQSVLGAD